MKRALITGITGQDGSHLAELLLSKGYEVHGIMRRTSNPSTERLSAVESRVTLHPGDMTDEFSLAKAIEKVQPHEVYNLAAQSQVHISSSVPYNTREINFHGVERLLHALDQACLGHEVRFYQASTSEMFGNASPAPQNEDSPMGPVSPYAEAKLDAHRLIQRERQNGKFYCAGILFNHEGPRRGLDFVTRKITNTIASIAKGKENVLVLGNLDAKRDWGFAGEYVEAMWMMLQQDKPDDYVIATGETHTVREFVERAFEAARITGYEIIDLSKESPNEADDRIKQLKEHGGIYVVQHPKWFRPAEVNLLQGDASKARRVLGWTPRTSFDELVTMMVKHDLALESGKKG